MWSRLCYFVELYSRPFCLLLMPFCCYHLLIIDLFICFNLWSLAFVLLLFLYFIFYVHARVWILINLFRLGERLASLQYSWFLLVFSYFIVCSLCCVWIVSTAWVILSVSKLIYYLFIQCVDGRKVRSIATVNELFIFCCIKLCLWFIPSLFLVNSKRLPITIIVVIYLFYFINIVPNGQYCIW